MDVVRAAKMRKWGSSLFRLRRAVDSKPRKCSRKSPFGIPRNVLMPLEELMGTKRRRDSFGNSIARKWSPETNDGIQMANLRERPQMRIIEQEPYMMNFSVERQHQRGDIGLIIKKRDSEPTKKLKTPVKIPIEKRNTGNVRKMGLRVTRGNTWQTNAKPTSLEDINYFARI